MLKPDEDNLEFEILQILLRLIGEEFFLNSATKKWSLPLRLSLIWAHSSEIYNNVIKLAVGDADELGEIWMNLHIWLEPLLFNLWRDLSVEQIQGIGKNMLKTKSFR